MFSSKLATISYPEYMVSSTDLNSLNDILIRNEKIIKMLNTSTDELPTMEGILDTLKKMLVGLLNLVIGVINNFKTGILSNFKTFKRSELREFNESNRISLNLLFKKDFMEIKDLVIEIPKNMSKPFSKVVDTIKAALIDYDTENIVNKNLVILNTVLSSMSTNVNIKKFLSNNKIDTKSMYNKNKEIEKIFNGPEMENVVSFYFKDIEDIKYVNETLLKMEIYYQSVDYINNKLNSTKETIDKIISELLSSNSDSLTISKDDILSISSTVKDLAETFNLFGNALKYLHSVEHNFCQTLKNMK